MTLADFIMHTIKEVLDEDSRTSAPSPSPVSSARASAPTAKGKRTLVTEKMIVEAFESGRGFDCSPEFLLTPSAKDALNRYKNKQ